MIFGRHLVRARWGGGQGRSAYSLIEVLIVLAIMAIVLATGVPSLLRGLEKDALKRAVNSVVEGCSHARAMAILQGRPAEFVLVAEDGRMYAQPVPLGQIDEGPDRMFSEAEPPAPVAEASTKPAFSAALDEDIAVELLYVNLQDLMSESSAHVHFFPNGTSDECTIILSSVQGSYKISLDVVTGLAMADRIR